MAFSLFNFGKSDSNDSKQKVVEVKLDQIVPNRYQPRQVFDKEGIQELAQTIDEHGLLQPIVIREYEPAKYEIIAGERRFRAMKLLQWETAPAIIEKMSDHEAASLALVENLQRSQLPLVRPPVRRQPHSPYTLLAELCLPAARVGGELVAYKASAADDELADAQGAISKLGGEVQKEFAMTHTIFYLLHPEAFTTKKMWVDVQTEGPAIGATVGDVRAAYHDGKTNAEVCLDIDADYFNKWFLDEVSKMN